MTTRVLAFFVAVILTTPLAAKEVVASPALPSELHETAPATRAPGDVCEACNNGYYWTIDQWFTGNEAYRVYCEPCRCPSCPGGWRPLAVTMYLFWEVENSCALSVSAEIVSANTDNPDCPTPEDVVCASTPITVGPFSPAGLWAVTIPLPGDAPFLREPFYASLRFHSTCDELPAVVTDDGPCGPCVAWNDWGQGWQELCGYGFPGNLSLFATLECQGPTPVERATWTTIKTMYR